LAALLQSNLGDLTMKLTMRFLALALAILMISATASAQTPAPVGSYVNSGSGWTPLLGTATQGALAFNPPPAALYVFNSSLGKWYHGRGHRAEADQARS